MVGTIVFHYSSDRTTVELLLKSKEAVKVNLFRFIPHKLELSLVFQRTPGQSRLELGRSAHNSNFKEIGILDFSQPGQPINYQFVTEIKKSYTK